MNNKAEKVHLVVKLLFSKIPEDENGEQTERIMVFLKMRSAVISLICSLGWLICGLITWLNFSETGESDPGFQLETMHR